MGDPLEGPKHRSGVASLMKNESQDWDSCSESPQTSQYPHPASWFAFAPFFLCQPPPLVSLLSWQKAAILWLPILFSSQFKRPANIHWYLSEASVQTNKSNCSTFGVCRLPFHASHLGQNLFIWPHLAVREVRLCGLSLGGHRLCGVYH